MAKKTLIALRIDHQTPISIYMIYLRMSEEQANLLHASLHDQAERFTRRPEYTMETAFAAVLKHYKDHALFSEDYQTLHILALMAKLGIIIVTPNQATVIMRSVYDQVAREMPKGGKQRWKHYRNACDVAFRLIVAHLPCVKRLIRERYGESESLSAADMMNGFTLLSATGGQLELCKCQMLAKITAEYHVPMAAVEKYLKVFGAVRADDLVGLLDKGLINQAAIEKLIENPRFTRSARLDELTHFLLNSTSPA